MFLSEVLKKFEPFADGEWRGLVPGPPVDPDVLDFVALKWSRFYESDSAVICGQILNRLKFKLSSMTSVAF
jgi:hypothetical protein